METDRAIFWYAFATPVHHELPLVDSQKVPTHRLWGMVELTRLGCEAGLCPPLPQRLKRAGSIAWRVWQTVWILNKASKKDTIVAVHEISALFFLLARRLGFETPSIFILNLALLHPKNQTGFRGIIWRVLLGKANRIVSLVESQLSAITVFFGIPFERQTFLPMLVDYAFFQNTEIIPEERFILAVGTNDGKDFETLLEALPLGERLVVITDSFNAAKIRAHELFGLGVEILQNVPAQQLVRWYRRAQVVVVPLADSPHGSGHTVLLENMALGKILVVSESRNMRGYVKTGVNCIGVPVADVAALRNALSRILDSPKDYNFLRTNAMRDARESFEAMRFGREIKALALAVGKDRNGESNGANAPHYQEESEHASIS